MEGWKIALRIRHIGSLKPRPFTRRKYSRRRFDRKLGGPECRCGCYGTRNICCVFRESNTASVRSPVVVLNCPVPLVLCLLSIPLTQHSADRMEKKETEGDCFTCGVEERCIQSFGGETRRKDTTLRTLT